jgi:hypothetical protein
MEDAMCNAIERFVVTSLLLAYGALIDTGAARAGDNTLPLPNGTYSARREYCDDVRKNDWSISGNVEKALVSINDNQIFWNEAHFEITNITRRSKGIIAHITGVYEDIVMEDDVNIELIAKDRFILDGIEYFYCTGKFPEAQ